MDRGVIATASELFEARHYPGVIALISDALEAEPDCVPLLLVRARAQIALRRDLDAQADLRDIIRLDPQCSLAYRLLGELAARRDENESAAIFFREALRLDPGDHEAETWLAIVQATARPAAAASKLPAPAAAAGRFPSRATAARPRFPSGTSAPDDERPTARFSAVRPPRATQPPPTARVVSAAAAAVRRSVGAYAPDVPTEHEIAALPPPPNFVVPEGSDPNASALSPDAFATYVPPAVGKLAPAAKTQAIQLPNAAPVAQPRHAGVFQAYPAITDTDAPTPALARGSEPHVPYPRASTDTSEQRTKQGAQPVRRPLSQPSPASLSSASPRGSLPELPGFGDYLVSTGILTRERLRAAQAYQRSMKVQLATAIVTLGLATPQRIEWAAVAHQSQLARGS